MKTLKEYTIALSAVVETLFIEIDDLRTENKALRKELRKVTLGRSITKNMRNNAETVERDRVARG